LEKTLRVNDHMESAVKIIKDFPSPHGIKYDRDLWYQQHGHAHVIINCSATGIFYPEHWTPLSMKCVFSGKEYYNLHHFSYAVSPHNFLLLNEGTTYSSSIDSDLASESFTLNFTRENIHSLVAVFGKTAENILDEPFQQGNGDLRFMEKLYEFNPALNAGIRRLKYLTDESPQDHAVITELLYDLLFELILLDRTTNREIEKVCSKKASTRYELYRRLSIAKDYMDSCYPENITLEKIAKLCCLNPFHLLREFRKNFHLTPHRYLMHARIRAARELVINTVKPVSQIATEVGFEAHSSFSRLYKKIHGHSPVEHRSAPAKDLFFSEIGQVIGDLE
jgi:AraC family transcriptional regulator